jgi:polyphosphate kinase
VVLKQLTFWSKLPVLSLGQQAESLEILDVIDHQLRKEHIYRINEAEIGYRSTRVHKIGIFYQELSPALVVIVLNDDVDLPELTDSAAYLAV